MLRAIVVGVVVAAAAIGASSTAAAEPSLVAGAGGIATSPGPFLECPAGTYQGSSGDCVESPDSSTSNATAICRDGSDSHSEHRAGTCSGHGGVSQWCPCGGLASGQSNAAAVPGNDPDSVYVSYENSHGVSILIDTPDIRQAMRNFAMDKICGPLNKGAIAAQVARPLLDQGDTRNSAQTDMTGAVVAYCPSYLGPVNAYWQSNS